MKIQNTIIFLVLLVSMSCVSRVSDITVKTEAVLCFPLVCGEYVLGDLFYDYEDTVVVNNGQFYNIADTLILSQPSFFDFTNQMQIVFKATNYIPFQVDLEVVLLDSVADYAELSSYEMTIIEPATLEEELEIAIPVYAENEFDVDAELFDEILKANKMKIDAKFIWPHQDVATPVIDDLLAFKLVVNLEMKAKQFD